VPCWSTIDHSSAPHTHTPIYTPFRRIASKLATSSATNHQNSKTNQLRMYSMQVETALAINYAPYVRVPQLLMTMVDLDKLSCTAFHRIWLVQLLKCPRYKNGTQKGSELYAKFYHNPQMVCFAAVYSTTTAKESNWTSHTRSTYSGSDVKGW
jgi:hypothetical protein